MPRSGKGGVVHEHSEMRVRLVENFWNVQSHTTLVIESCFIERQTAW